MTQDAAASQQPPVGGAQSPNSVTLTTPPAPADAPPPSEQLLAGKYKTPQELEKAYKELEAKLGQPQQPAADAPADPAATDAAAQQAVSDAGLDFEALAQEVQTNGKLTDESYAALQRVGIPKEIADAYIQGQQALVEKQISTVLDPIGGREAYTEMTRWASAVMNPQEIEAFNKAVTGSDLNTVQMAVQGLHARYTAANGKQPNLVQGQPGGGQAGYGSLQEMMRDMNDPKYLSGDPVFHKMVDQKIANKTF